MESTRYTSPAAERLRVAAVGRAGTAQLFAADRTKRQFRGMALAFGAPIDCTPPTIFQRGAFTNTLRDQGARCKILWQHDQWDPIGRPTFRETMQGLEVVGILDTVPNGDRALLQIESGTLTDLSIGWDPIRWEMVKPEALSRFGARADAISKYTALGGLVRVVTEARLWEVSVVTFGAQPAARISAGDPSTAAKMAEIDQYVQREREARFAYIENMARLIAAEAAMSGARG
jgi:phage head maturation protease